QLPVLHAPRGEVARLHKPQDPVRAAPGIPRLPLLVRGPGRRPGPLRTTGRAGPPRPLGRAYHPPGRGLPGHGGKEHRAARPQRRVRPRTTPPHARGTEAVRPRLAQRIPAPPPGRTPPRGRPTLLRRGGW